MGLQRVRTGDNIVITNPTRGHEHFRDLKVKADEVDERSGLIRVGKEYFSQNEVRGTR